MSKIHVLIGQTASGKTDAFNEIVKQLNDDGVIGIQPIVTSTTRPSRPGEVFGKDYYFVSDEDFEKGHFVCHDKYIVEPHGLCSYGIDVDRNDLFDTGSDKIVILSPSGYRELKNKFGDRVVGHYIMASEKTRKTRYLKRENFSDAATERVDRRIEADLVDFENFEYEVENVYINERSLEKVVDSIIFEIYFGVNYQ